MKLTDTNPHNLILALVKFSICLLFGSILLCAIGILLGRFRYSPQLAYLGDAYTVRLADLYHRLSLPLNLYLEDTPINLNWSPNGRWLSFFLLQNGQYNLYAVNMDTQQMQTIAERVPSSVAPAWSPDGTRIAYAPNGIHLCIQPLTSRSPACHNVNRITQVVWSPDSAALAYINPLSDEAGIYLFDPETQDAKRLIRTSPLIAELNWSSDSQRIFYTAAVNSQSERDLYWVNISTRLTRNLTQGKLGYVSEVVLSPDDQHLSFRGITNDIYLLNLADNEYKNLTDSQTADDGSADWSADGRWLAFASIENQGRQPHILIWSQSTGFEFFAYTFSFDLAWRPHI